MKPAARTTRNPSDDDTVRIAPKREPTKPRPKPAPFGAIFAGALVVGLGAGAAIWFLWPHSQPPAIATLAPPPPAVLLPPPAVPPAPRPPEFRIDSTTEALLRDNTTTGLSIFRLAANPNILILDFASLLDQGAMLNRLGAFAEKAGLPHDRLLTDAELQQAILAGGDTAETYYYGHDYSAAEIARFFAIAGRDRIALNTQEETLRRLMQQVGWLAENKAGGLISVPRVGANAEVTADSRATILHHELSHGEYFSNPAFAAYTRRFWTTLLTPVERDGMRKFLAKEGYDIANDMLVENEAQAYIVFTLNPAFFEPATIGMAEARRAALRATFLREMPTDWLRDSAPPKPEIARATIR